MNLIKCFTMLLLLTCISLSYAKLKLVAFKGPFGGFVGLKYRKPKLLGFKHGHGFGGHGFGHGGFGGGFHGHFGGGLGGWLGR